jgi:dUTP pyrophosphatase
MSNKDDLVKFDIKNGGKYKHIPGEAGLDILCPHTVTIPARSFSNKVLLGIYCQAYDSNDGGVSYFLMPRSSMGASTPLRLSNSIGLIDASYRGQITALVDNLSDKDYIIEKDSRLFQLVFVPIYTNLNINVVDELSSTTRGAGAFGSTGK